MENKILKSENIKHGFYGTLRIHNSKKKTEELWNKAFSTLQKLSGVEPEEIRLFLDSKDGRWLADTYHELKQDIEDIITEGYFGGYERSLFNDREKGYTKKFEYNYNNELFGSKVYNHITSQVDILLATYIHPNRIYKDYALCITPNRKQYHINRDYIVILDNLTEEDLEELGLK